MDGMLREIPSHLLIEWMAFYNLEPFGREAEFQGHALVSSIIAESNRDPKKKADAFTTSDFMPKEEDDSEEVQSVFKRLKDHLVNNSNLQNS